MILVDSSVRIEFFRNEPTLQVEWLDRNFATEGVLVGDLILAELLRGFKEERGFEEARRMLSRLDQVVPGGENLAVDAARNCRKLRAKGVTVRRTIDVIIATRCLADGLLLLHSDRDFDAFETHLGLRVVDCGPYRLSSADGKSAAFDGPLELMVSSIIAIAAKEMHLRTAVL